MKKLIIIIFAFLPFALQSQTIDTSAWAFKTVGGDGTYRLLENRSTYLGKSAGTVVIPLQFDVNGVDTAKWGFLPIGSDGTFRLVYNKETFYGKDSGTVVAQLVYTSLFSSDNVWTGSNTFEGVTIIDSLIVINLISESIPASVGNLDLSGGVYPFFGASGDYVLGVPSQWIEVEYDGNTYIIPLFAKP